jgi:hypothetical protein
MNSADIVREYVAKYTDMPTLTMAKLILKEEPNLYMNVSCARDAVRRIRGKNGQNHKYKTNEHLFDKGPRPYNPFEPLPEGIREIGEMLPFKIPNKKVLCLFDLHAPYHSKEALKAALEYSRGEVDAVLMQEGFDFYQLSTFEKDPRNKDVAYERRIVNDIIRFIKKYLGIKDFYYQRGNHCQRWDRYLKVKARELLGMDEFKFDMLFDKDLNVTLTPDMHRVMLGKLNVLHGHEFG